MDITRLIYAMDPNNSVIEKLRCRFYISMKVYVVGAHYKCLAEVFQMGSTTYFHVEIILNEPAHDKTYNKICVTSKDSNPPAQPPSMASLFG